MFRVLVVLAVAAGLLLHPHKAHAQTAPNPNVVGENVINYGEAYVGRNYSGASWVDCAAAYCDRLADHGTYYAVKMEPGQRFVRGRAYYTATSAGWSTSKSWSIKGRRHVAKARDINDDVLGRLHYVLQRTHYEYYDPELPAAPPLNGCNPIRSKSACANKRKS